MKKAKTYTGWKAVKALQEGKILQDAWSRFIYKVDAGALFSNHPGFTGDGKKAYKTKHWKSEEYSHRGGYYAADQLISAKFVEYREDKE